MIMRILLAVLLILMASVVPTLADPPTAPGAQDRCAVCGMFVSPYPNWVSVIRFRDGQSAYFDGPRDMFSFFFNLET
jgi:copper chaperone NosL